MTQELERQLNSIDWNFEGAWTQEGIHGLHWYPGAFIPQIANNLVRLLTKPGEWVLDPFCGCGTTLVESIKLGRPAIGIDCNTLGVLISKVKCSTFSTEMLHSDLDIIRKSTHGILFEFPRSIIDSEKYSTLSKWFSQHTLTLLLRLWDIIQHETNGSELEFFLVCLSHILKASCSQEKHWGWIADNVVPKIMKDKDVLTVFVRHCSDMICAFEQFYNRLDTIDQTSRDIVSNSVVYLHDCRFPTKITRKVDAVITSPPYPFVTDYTKAHRLSYALFEWNFDQDRQIEIGARWKRTRKKQVEEYKQDIMQAFRNIDPLLKNGGLIGLVIDATKRRRSVLSDSIYVDVADILKKHFGYENIGKYRKRQFSDQRFVDSKGNQNTEAIVVLRKP